MTPILSWEVRQKFFEKLAQKLAFPPRKSSEVGLPAKKKVLPKKFWENHQKPIRSQFRSLPEYYAFMPVLRNPNEVLMCVKRCKKRHTWVLLICAWSKTSEEALPTSQNNLLDIKRGCFEKFLRRWLYFAEVKTQMKYYVCKFCANSATPKYFSFLEHFSENILHSTSLMRNTFLSSYQFPPENTIRRIFHNISVRVATRLCGCAQPARFLCDGSRLSIAPQKIGSTIRECVKFGTAGTIGRVEALCSANFSKTSDDWEWPCHGVPSLRFFSWREGQLLSQLLKKLLSNFSWQDGC